MQPTIDVITKELHNAFSIFNKNYFEGKLPQPAITIQSAGKRKLSMGWCSRKPVWGDKEGKQMMYEINLSAEFLDLDFFETMDTLLHEMIHLYHQVNEIQDVSRKGTYHNKKFKNKALELGFEYESDKPDKLHGWSFARLGQNAKDTINNFDINQEVFTISRKGSYFFEQIKEGKNTNDEVDSSTLTITEPEKKPSSFKWQCPDCDMSVRSTKQEVNIICGDCNKKLENVTI